MAATISFDAALAAMARRVTPVGREWVALGEARGRVLAQAVIAGQDAPAQALAAMDGYALRDVDIAAGTPLTVVGEAFPGQSFAGRVGDRETVRIFTGAPMPAGTDRCIIQEQTRRDGQRLVILPGYGPGWHVRATGSDFASGDLLVPQGTVLTPRSIVAAAAANLAMLAVHTRPRVAIIGTGHELVAPGAGRIEANQVPDSLTFGIAALVAEAGGEVVQRKTAGDDLPRLQRLADEALSVADLVVTIGGASVGKCDFAKAMFQPFELKLHFAGVAIKPGKPVWFGQCENISVLGLPGNPTAAMVTAALFLRPLLAALQGRACDSALPWRWLPLAGELGPAPGRETFERAEWTADGLAPVADKASSSQAALVRSEWIVRRARGATRASPGERVEAIPF